MTQRLLDLVPVRKNNLLLEWKHPSGRWIRFHHPAAHMVGDFDDRLEASIAHRFACDLLIESLIEIASKPRPRGDLVPMLCGLYDTSRCSQNQI